MKLTNYKNKQLKIDHRKFIKSAKTEHLVFRSYGDHVASCNK